MFTLLNRSAYLTSSGMRWNHRTPREHYYGHAQCTHCAASPANPKKNCNNYTPWRNCAVRRTSRYGIGGRIPGRSSIKPGQGKHSFSAAFLPLHLCQIKVSEVTHQTSPTCKCSALTGPALREPRKCGSIFISSTRRQYSRCECGMLSLKRMIRADLPCASTY